MADWRFLRKPEFWITTIIAIILAFIGGLMYPSVENPSFNVQNSSRIAINYKSPNSPITITETKLIPGTCTGNVYTKMISFNNSFLSSFFSRPFNCDDATNAGIPDLKYDLFNVKFVLPTHQHLFISSVLANESYIIAYVNEDFSDACIPHKYQITPEFNQNDVCFNVMLGEKVCGDSGDSITITTGPLFKVNKESCYRMISGSYDFLGNWV